MNTKLHPTDLYQPRYRESNLACRSLLDATLKMASGVAAQLASQLAAEIGFIALSSVIGISLMTGAAEAAIGTNPNNESSVGHTKIGVTALSVAVNNSDPAAILRARYHGLRDRLNTNGFQRPIALDSFSTSDDVKGEIYAVVPTRFGNVNESLAMPQVWCDILILHLNTKYCRVVMPQQQSGQPSPAQAEANLVMNVGKKFDRPLDESYRLTFAWQLADQKVDYLRVQLNADEGPLSTRDYRITLEAIPLPSPLSSPLSSPLALQLAASNVNAVPAGAVAGNTHNSATLLHLSYSYRFGLTGKIAMLAYLNTVARAKVGFTVVGKNAGGDVSYVDGLRGLVERNTMRYYLAIESFLGALALPPTAQFEKRISDWFAATERYPKQLHEVERDAYIDMKRKENQR